MPVKTILKQINTAAYYLQQSEIASDPVIKNRYYKMYLVEKSKLNTIKSVLMESVI